MQVITERPKDMTLEEYRQRLRQQARDVKKRMQSGIIRIPDKNMNIKLKVK